APRRERLGVRAVELDELFAQVVEVETAGAAQRLFVGIVNTAQNLVSVAAVGDVLRPLELAFRLRDAVAEGADRVALGIQAELLEYPPQGRAGVVLVEDDKARPDADSLRLAAKDLDRRRVERADPHLLSTLADERLDPAA